MPAISKEEEVKAVEDNIKDEPPGGEELALEPAFAHSCQGVTVAQPAIKLKR